MTLMKTNHLQQLRRDVFKRLLFTVTLFLLLISAKSIYIGESSLYYVEVIFSALGVISCLFFDKWVTPRNVIFFTMVFSNLACCLLLYVLVIEGFNTTAYIWLTAIPVFSYMLNGIDNGVRLSFFYFGLAFIVLTSKQYIYPSIIAFDSILDIFFLVIVVWFLAHFYENTNRLSRQQLIEMATQDSLTGLNNRHAFYDFFERHKQSKIAVILIDLDFFKTVNDNYGHDTGDFILIEVANILKSYQTKTVQAFRLGGEEFLVMCVDVTPTEVMTIANHILVTIREHRYVHEGRALELTASMGVQVSDSLPSDLTYLMKYADYKLYAAKGAGRNRVVSELPAGFDINVYTASH